MAYRPNDIPTPVVFENGRVVHAYAKGEVEGRGECIVACGRRTMGAYLATPEDQLVLKSCRGCGPIPLSNFCAGCGTRFLLSGGWEQLASFASMCSYCVA